MGCAGGYVLTCIIRRFENATDDYLRRQCRRTTAYERCLIGAKCKSLLSTPAVTKMVSICSKNVMIISVAHTRKFRDVD